MPSIRMRPPVAADDRDRLTGVDGEAQVRQRILGRARVREAHVVESDLTPDGVGNRDGFGGSGERTRRLHQLEEVAQIEVVLVHPGEAAEDALDRVLHRLRRGRVEREVAERELADDRLERDIQIRHRGGDRAEVAPEKTDQVTPHHLPALPAVVGIADEPVAVDKVASEPE